MQASALAKAQMLRLRSSCFQWRNGNRRACKFSPGWRKRRAQATKPLNRLHIGAIARLDSFVREPEAREIKVKWNILMDWIENFNRELFLQINGGEGAPVWSVRAATCAADGLIYLIPVLLVGFWLWGDHARRSLAIKACLIVALDVAANQAIGAVWPHPRPFMIGLGHTWVQPAADSSFPSDHMTVFGGIGLTLLFDGAVTWAMGVLLIGFVVAWARVFLGLHFPLDMVGALGVATVAFAVVTPPWQAFGAPLTSLAERIYRHAFARPIALGWIDG